MFCQNSTLCQHLHNLTEAKDPEERSWCLHQIFGHIIPNMSSVVIHYQVGKTGHGESYWLSEVDWLFHLYQAHLTSPSSVPCEQPWRISASFSKSELAACWAIWWQAGNRQSQVITGGQGVLAALLSYPVEISTKAGESWPPSLSPA